MSLSLAGVGGGPASQGPPTSLVPSSRSSSSDSLTECERNCSCRGPPGACRSPFASLPSSPASNRNRILKAALEYHRRQPNINCSMAAKGRSQNGSINKRAMQFQQTTGCSEARPLSTDPLPPVSAATKGTDSTT